MIDEQERNLLCEEKLLPEIVSVFRFKRFIAIEVYSIRQAASIRSFTGSGIRNHSRLH